MMLEVVVALLRARWVLRRQGLLPALRRFATGPLGVRRELSPDALVGLAWRLSGWLRLSCLPRSLALVALLRGRGVDAALRIGVAKEAGLTRAHAWVEIDGAVVGEVLELPFVTLPLAALTTDLTKALQ